MKQKKETIFIMRAAQTDKAEIKRLAKRLHCSESEACRRAVRYTLAIMPKTAPTMR